MTCRGAQNPSVQGALAVALGLTGHAAAGPRLQRLLRERENDETLAGYLCIGVAMLGDPTVVPMLGDILQRSRRRPFLLLQAAVGLGRLGDRGANEQLLTMMRDSDSTAVLAALANAIGQIGDRRAIEPLVAMTTDNELTKLSRAFVAAALGGVGDGPVLPWNLPLSRDSNYGAPVDTLSTAAPACSTSSDVERPAAGHSCQRSCALVVANRPLAGFGVSISACQRRIVWPKPAGITRLKVEAAGRHTDDRDPAVLTIEVQAGDAEIDRRCPGVVQAQEQSADVGRMRAERAGDLQRHRVAGRQLLAAGLVQRAGVDLRLEHEVLVGARQVAPAARAITSGSDLPEFM